MSVVCAEPLASANKALSPIIWLAWRLRKCLAARRHLRRSDPSVSKLTTFFFTVTVAREVNRRVGNDHEISIILKLGSLHTTSVSLRRPSLPCDAIAVLKVSGLPPQVL